MGIQMRRRRKTIQSPLEDLFSTLATLAFATIFVVVGFMAYGLFTQVPNGVETQGEVVGSVKSYATEDGTTCSFEYTYRVHKTTYKDESKASSSSYCKYKAGDLVNVTYNAELPAQSKIKDSNIRIVLIFPVVGGLLGLFTLFGFIKRLIKQDYSGGTRLSSILGSLGALLFIGILGGFFIHTFQQVEQAAAQDLAVVWER